MPHGKAPFVQTAKDHPYRGSSNNEDAIRLHLRLYYTSEVFIAELCEELHIPFVSLPGLDTTSKAESLIDAAKLQWGLPALAKAMGWDPSGVTPYPEPARSSWEFFAHLQEFLAAGNVERANRCLYYEGRIHDVLPQEAKFYYKIAARTIYTWAIGIEPVAFEHMIPFLQSLYPDEKLIQYLYLNINSFNIKVETYMRENDPEFVAIFKQVLAKQGNWNRPVRPRPGYMRTYCPYPYDLPVPEI